MYTTNTQTKTIFQFHHGAFLKLTPKSQEWNVCQNVIFCANPSLFDNLHTIDYLFPAMYVQLLKLLFYDQNSVLSFLSSKIKHGIKMVERKLEGHHFAFKMLNAIYQDKNEDLCCKITSI
jgi:hypothetical protein